MINKILVKFLFIIKLGIKRNKMFNNVTDKTEAHMNQQYTIKFWTGTFEKKVLKRGYATKKLKLNINCIQNLYCSQAKTNNSPWWTFYTVIIF